MSFFTILDILHIIKALEIIVNSKGFLFVIKKRNLLLYVKICTNIYPYIYIS